MIPNFEFRAFGADYDTNAIRLKAIILFSAIIYINANGRGSRFSD